MSRHQPQLLDNVSDDRTILWYLANQLQSNVSASHTMPANPVAVRADPNCWITQHRNSGEECRRRAPWDGDTQNPNFPAFAAFMAIGVTYTTYVASKEGATIDGARTRWQGQHASARRVLSGGMSMEEFAKMQIS
ncbi:hypothetical protein SNOG_02424 [Parastagonospora nodorum SN15]|uniref:Uncharacterized protein n=1 Tax=Phaeosphaeria nodorum (strain SN15 / ATCC MYA-4574 / FGSC 10173) TaxID=321614 RepID=Q0V0P0_PHANO|nr:hypothetical protein SNOG_02424 [Parastagonospora nodorum SN15]EAT90636.1 hypothetical protein SNOG_02424 [Parastagonospora nodorum SN15]